MEQSATLDIESLKITQEQFILASQSLHLQRPGCEAVYPVGLYGWRKRCLYFFLLLLLVTMIVNLALTVWIMKVMNFSVDGMGNLRLEQEGIRLEGISEFLLPLYVNEIRSRRESVLVLQSDKNVTLNARDDRGQLTGQLTVGPEAVEAQCQKLEVRSRDGGRLLFTADEEEVVMTTEKFTVTGSEGAVFGHSVETPLIQTRASEDLRLESPTRTLTMEAPRGVEVSAAKGPLKVSSRKDLQMESTEGEILLDADTIQLGSLPLGVYTASAGQASREQAAYEVCVCPSGKIYLSPAEGSSTCQAMSNICLWS
ncbi:putative zeta-sarcoglycan-like [Scophthalmus maximus]|uniref:Putative zeta-sarcoglycan-like n=1 Tax=Scophthalmus maximus TaxID=52904 RepID=A0A2U9B1C9_SCOMX|nr:zeta-sarcoglycan-like [Scophthalmus maximus]AWO97677.1 putative zeta-sarcoglycan-like [Scophthalmus maximus]